jgi:hypothetical protein
MALQDPALSEATREYVMGRRLGPEG